MKELCKNCKHYNTEFIGVMGNKAHYYCAKRRPISSDEYGSKKAPTCIHDIMYLTDEFELYTKDEEMKERKRLNKYIGELLGDNELLKTSVKKLKSRLIKKLKSRLTAIEEDDERD